MSSLRSVISAAWLACCALALGVTIVVAAGAPPQQQRPFRLSDQQVEQIMRAVERRSETFRTSLDAALDRGRLDGTQTEDEINRLVSEFTGATDNLRERFNNRRSVAGDVENVLNRAGGIDAFVRRNRLTVRAQNDWTALKTDLDRLANAYEVSWNWTTQGGSTGVAGRPYRLNDTQVEAIINRVEQRAGDFRRSADQALDQSRLDGTRTEDELNDFLKSFETSTDRLRERFNNRRSVAADVENVLDQAVQLDRFMQRNSLMSRAARDWSLLKSQLDELARAYNVAPRWSNGNADYPSNSSNIGGRLTGTYRLDAARSDDPRAIGERATRDLPINARERVMNLLMRRLESPNALAIDQRNRTVTIASSRAAQTTFEADGRERVEQLPNGRTSRVSATLRGDALEVSSAGDRATDFTVTFTPVDNGRRLQITRRVTTDRLNEPVVIQSYYDRTDNVAQWSVYDGGTLFPDSSSDTATNSGEFTVPDGTSLVAVLDNDLTTKQSRDGDRFTMRVRDPARYDGAVIEGYVSGLQSGGRVTGRSQMTLNFERIRLRDGRTYKFAGLVEKVLTPTGENVAVDNEGAVQEGDSQSQRTIQRTAIGSAIGAVIGAIAGGGKGAAIGAVVGAGAGAGSVYVQGRDELDLLKGSELTVRASAPR